MSSRSTWFKAVTGIHTHIVNTANRPRREVDFSKVLYNCNRVLQAGTHECSAVEKGMIDPVIRLIAVTKTHGKKLSGDTLDTTTPSIYK